MCRRSIQARSKSHCYAANRAITSRPISRFGATPVNKFGSSGVAVGSTRCRSTPRTKPTIALQIKRQTLEQPRDISQPIAAAFEYFQLVVQPFNKTAGLIVDVVVVYPPLPGVQHREECLEAVKTAPLDPLPPEAK